MSIMELVRNLGKKRGESSKKFKEMQEQDRLETMLLERKKSANRRELERRMNDAEEKQIKKTLDVLRKKEQRETWKSNSFLKRSKSILKEDRPILKEKNIFHNNKSIFMNKGSLF